MFRKYLREQSNSFDYLYNDSKRLRTTIDRVCSEHVSDSVPDEVAIEDVMEMLLKLLSNLVSEPEVDEDEIEYIKTHRFSKMKLKTALYDFVYDVLEYYVYSIRGDADFAELLDQWRS